jgi:transcriptional regulator with XRE-family HTH domain
MKNQRSANASLQHIVAENVKAKRLALGLSQEELADNCSYHRTYIGSIERAERNITLTTLQALAKALDVAPEELLRRGNV